MPNTLKNEFGSEAVLKKIINPPLPGDSKKEPMSDEAVDAMIKSMEKSNWVNLFLQAGSDTTIDKISGYLGNLGIISVLLAGFTISIMFSPPPELTSSASKKWWLKDGYYHPAASIGFGTMGFLCFFLFFLSVIDCIFIDNALRQVPTPKALMNFIAHERSWIGRPSKFFFLGMLGTFLEICVATSVLYPAPVTIIVILICIQSVRFILGAYGRGVGHLKDYAILSKNELEGHPERGLLEGDDESTAAVSA